MGVVQTRKKSGYTAGEWEYQLEDGTHTRPGGLVADTPAALAAFKAAQAFDEETRKIEKRRNVESGELWDKVQHAPDIARG